MNLLDCLKMTKTALQNEAAELYRCNSRYSEIQKEIMEIDVLILKIERTEARRRSIYEKRIRTIKRMRDREIRRGIYSRLPLDPVGTRRNFGLVHRRRIFVRRSV